MADDFSELPPSRRCVSAEDAALTPEQRREAEVARLWGDDEPQKPKPPLWQPATPSDPRTLKLLQHPHAANGMPLGPGRFAEPMPPRDGASDKEMLAYTGARHRAWSEWQAQDADYMMRYRYWVSLDVCSKSQLASEAIYANDAEPRWSCSVPSDPHQPPLIVRGIDQYQARERYRILLGCSKPTAQNPHELPVTVGPYAPAA
jgi:hypothetical protein